jgi:hypothetical protein
VKSLANITWYCACVSVVARLKRKDIREIGVSGCVLMFLFGMTAYGCKCEFIISRTSDILGPLAQVVQ